jgi:hypothetical protein
MNMQSRRLRDASLRDETFGMTDSYSCCKRPVLEWETALFGDKNNAS